MKERRGALTRPCSIPQQKSSCFDIKSKCLRTFIRSLFPFTKFYYLHIHRCQCLCSQVLFCQQNLTCIFFIPQVVIHSLDQLNCSGVMMDGQFFFFSLSVFVSLSYMALHQSLHIFTCTHTEPPPPTDSHVGIGRCVFSCLFFFMLCLYTLLE